MERLVVRMYPNGGIKFISEKNEVKVLLIQHCETGVGEDPVLTEENVSDVNAAHVIYAFDKYGG